MKLGQIVFIFCDSALEPGRVVGVFGGKVEVESTGGIRTVYADRRVAHESGFEVHSTEGLNQYMERVHERVGQIDLSELWSIMLEVGNAPYTLDTLADWLFPNGSFAAKDAVFWRLSEDRLYFKRGKDQRFTPNSAVAVQERQNRLQAELAAADEMRGMVQWLHCPEMPADSVGEKAIALLKEIVLFENDSTHIVKARQLIRTTWPKNIATDVQLAWDFLRQNGIWQEHENLAVLRSGMSTKFSKDALSESNERRTQALDTDKRVDYRTWTAIAVDDEHTTEVDDALAIRIAENGERTVAVFIADASHWVPEGNPMDCAAQERATTVYLPEGKVPMLPPGIGQDLASLVVGQERLALASVFTITAEGQLIDFRIEEAVMQLSARLTYETVDSIMDGADHEHADAVRELSRLADVFRASRLQNGALILDRFETTVNVDEEHYVTIGQYWTGGVSHRLVSEWMIITCSNVALWFQERRIPALYRGQDAPEGKIRIPESRALRPHELQKALRLIRGAFMTCEPVPHFGLGLPCYAQVTSPLRRYPDLLMHRQIRHVLRRGQPLFSIADLQKKQEMVEHRARAAVRVERASRRYWLLHELQQRHDEPLEVEVVRKIGRRFLVHVLCNGLKTLWSGTKDVNIGDRRTLRIDVVNPRQDKLVFSE